MTIDASEFFDDDEHRQLYLPEAMKYAGVKIVKGVCFIHSCVSYPELKMGGESKPWFKSNADDFSAVGEAVQRALAAFRYSDLPESVVEPRDLFECESTKRYRGEWNKFIGFGSRKFYYEGGKVINVSQYKNEIRCQGTTLSADGGASSEYSRHPSWGAWAHGSMGIGEAVMRAAADCLFKLPRSVRTAKEPPL
jgi:hypothetical protein